MPHSRAQISARLVALLLLIGAVRAPAQDFPFPDGAGSDDDQLARTIPLLARDILSAGDDQGRSRDLSEHFRLQLAAGQFADAVVTLDRHLQATASSPSNLSAAVVLYARSVARQDAERIAFEDAGRETLREALAALHDRAAYDTAWSLGTLPSIVRRRLQPLLDRQKTKATIQRAHAVELIGAWLDYQGHRALAPFLDGVIAEDEARRYLVQDDVLIPTKHGATLSAIVVRSRRASRQPAALLSVIQTDVAMMLTQAKYAASRGYVGVSSDSRGKRLSPDEIVPFEHDAKDLHGVIDWISRQPWSDGQVGMYGGSYSGFAQWAAAKTRHPALKTIVPYCPNHPGFGLPMNNNIFLTANYDYFFFVANTKYLDAKFATPGRYDEALAQWYRSGRPFREIDRVDGHPNKHLQRFLQHPAYDDYWQGLAAEGRDYRRLDIPVLAIDGYYDDGQNDAVRRLREHYRYRPNAEHYLVIGPYDHFGAQSARKAAELRGYRIDPVAQLDTPALTFQWFDYIMRGGSKPALLRDKINYQVMGTNVWRHAPSVEAMSTDKLELFLTGARSGDYFELSANAPALESSVRQVVDFADRSQRSAAYYPSEILSSKLDRRNAMAFVSEPFEAPLSISGQFSATLRAMSNKKDMDIVLVLYEITPAGEFFHLSYTVQRASYARDMRRRRLLRPHRPQTIPLENTLLVSRRLSKGSRLLALLDINRGPHAQVNHGTGKDVSDESVADAKEPLIVEWLTGSSLVLPISWEKDN